MSLEVDRAARELQMLEGMVDCAYELGMAFSGAVKAEADTTRSLELADAYLKTFLAVRMGIRLSMALRAPPKAAAPERTQAVEREPIESEPTEGDRPERADSSERDRERDRDYEPVSLPKFLSTLGVVARDAARLGDRLPAAAAEVVPTLQGLLAQAATDPPATEQVPTPAADTPAAGLAVLTRPPQGGARHRLLGSAATTAPRPGRPRPWPDSG